MWIHDLSINFSFRKNPVLLGYKICNFHGQWPHGHDFLHVYKISKLIIPISWNWFYMTILIWNLLQYRYHLSIKCRFYYIITPNLDIISPIHKNSYEWNKTKTNNLQIYIWWKLTYSSRNQCSCVWLYN